MIFAILKTKRLMEKLMQIVINGGHLAFAE